jgi:hypothetical protein
MRNENLQKPQPKLHWKDLGIFVSWLFVISGLVLAVTNSATILLNAGWIPKVSFYSGDPKPLLVWIAGAALMLAVVGLGVTIYCAWHKKDRLSEIFPEMKPESLLNVKVWYAVLIAFNALMGTTYQSPVQYTWVLYGLAFAYVRFSIDEYIKSQRHLETVKD